MRIPQIHTLRVLTLLLIAGRAASAAPVLDGWAFNIDGQFTTFADKVPATAADMPDSVNATQFDAGTINLQAGLATGTGLGTLVVTVTGPGAHRVVVWFDLHIDTDPIDSIYFSEYGAAVGTPEAGQSWQIDEPGYIAGTIYDNVQAGLSLPNTNSVSDSNNPDDVSLALGHNFTLAEGQTARLTFDVATVGPVTAFYLRQNRRNLPGDPLFMSSSLAITGIPEPGTWVMSLGAFLSFVIARKLRIRAAA